MSDLEPGSQLSSATRYRRFVYAVKNYFSVAGGGLEGGERSATDRYGCDVSPY